MKVYGDLESGNCYKVALALARLGRSHDWVHVDVLAGESRTPEFLARNPNGRIPVLELDDGTFLAESNAILWYLATDSELLPQGRLEQARVLQWMFFEQYSHEPFIATSRYWILYLDGREEYAAQLAEKREPGYRALGVMEAHLSNHDFFVDERFSIADIALFAYTHVAEEGDFELDRFPAVRNWIERIEALPKHLAMRP
jgi:glutathione S-transferase